MKYIIVQKAVDAAADTVIELPEIETWEKKGYTLEKIIPKTRKHPTSVSKTMVYMLFKEKGGRKVGGT